VDPLETRVCRIEPVMAFRRDDDRRHGAARESVAGARVNKANFLVDTGMTAA
jgi:hypothetical protein